MDVSMRYGTQGIIASMRPLHAPVPVTPAGHGGILPTSLTQEADQLGQQPQQQEQQPQAQQPATATPTERI